METKQMTASDMGKKSAERRGLTKMTPQERSEYMKKVRAGKSPTTQA